MTSEGLVDDLLHILSEFIIKYHNLPDARMALLDVKRAMHKRCVEDSVENIEYLGRAVAHHDYHTELLEDLLKEYGTRPHHIHSMPFFDREEDAEEEEES